MKTVSVIIPTFNRCKFLAKTIDSVLAQKMPSDWSLEVIVVDDGSTDSTPELMKKYADKVIYQRISNSGRPAIPRNVALKLAKGDLVAFQDSDDLWKLNKLSKQIPAFDDPAVVLTYCDADIITSEGKLTGKKILEPGQGKNGHVFNELVKVNFVSTLTVVVRKGIVLSAGGFDESSSLRGVEDYELWLRLSRMGKFIFIDEPLAFHRLHEFNISNDIDHKFNEHILAAHRSVLSHSLTRLEKKALYDQDRRIFLQNVKRSSGLVRLRFQALAASRHLLSRI